MRGWLLLCIVLSVLWFVGFAYWRVESDASEADQISVSMVQSCWSGFGARVDSLYSAGDLQRRDEKMQEFGREREACLKQAIDIYEKRSYPLYESTMWVTDAASVAFFWMLAWIVVRVGRWVIAGFRQEA
jgi:hypothetical protein